MTKRDVLTSLNITMTRRQNLQWLHLVYPSWTRDMEYLVWHANAPGRNGNVALRKTLKTSWTAKVTNERLLTNANVTQTVRRHQNRKKTFRTRYAQKRTGQSIGKRQSDAFEHQRTS